MMASRSLLEGIMAFSSMVEEGMIQFSPHFLMNVSQMLLLFNVRGCLFSLSKFMLMPSVHFVAYAKWHDSILTKFVQNLDSSQISNSHNLTQLTNTIQITLT
jgi:hypothetical protein